MENVICFYREPFFTYLGFAAIAAVSLLLCSSLLCLRFRFTRRERLKMLLVALAALGAGLGLMRVFGVIARALLEASRGDRSSFAALVKASGSVCYGLILGDLGMIALLLPRVLPRRARLGADILASSAALALGFVRMGCYCNAKVENGFLVWQPCCGGIRMDNAFCAHFYDSRLPTQLIESAASFLLFAVMLTLLLRGKGRGRLPTLYLAVYSVFRYIIEFFREGVMDVHIGPFSFSQFIALLVLLGVLIVSALRQKGLLRTPPPDKEM